MPKTANIEVQVPTRLLAELHAVAKDAGLKPETVLKLALATEMRRWRHDQGVRAERDTAIYALRDGNALVVPDASEYTRKFESRVFGATRDATKDEVSRIEKLAADCPVAVFTALNRILNARGLCITIDAPEPPNA